MQSNGRIVIIAGVSVLALAIAQFYLSHPLLSFALIAAAFAAGFALARYFVSGPALSRPSVSAASSPSGGLKWTDVIAALPEPAIVVDASSTVLQFNAAAQGIFEKLKPGLSLERINRDPELIGAVSDALERHATRTVRLALLGGHDRHLLATITPLGNSTTATVAALITLHDLSEQHRLLEMRSDFIANASHELRTPIAALRGFIETLQGPARNDAAARERFLSIMADQSERMTRLIDDLLLLSRVEEKANLRPTGHVDLHKVIEDVVRSMAPIAAERCCTISTSFAPDAQTVTGDRDELYQVFQNIIENAVKYGREGGKVDVSTEVSAPRAGKTRVTVVIADDGPGVAPEHLPRLTERFYRVNTEHSRKTGGTGLGLAIVKHVLNRHDGELRAESIVGKGTTFRVILPAG